MIRLTKFSDENTAYVVLPYLTIIVKKKDKEVLFKMGSKTKGLDYEWFKECIIFLFSELQCKGKEQKND